MTSSRFQRGGLLLDADMVDVCRAVVRSIHGRRYEICEGGREPRAMVVGDENRFDRRSAAGMVNLFTSGGNGMNASTRRSLFDAFGQVKESYDVMNRYCYR